MSVRSEESPGLSQNSPSVVTLRGHHCTSFAKPWRLLWPFYVSTGCTYEISDENGTDSLLGERIPEEYLNRIRFIKEHVNSPIPRAELAFRVRERRQSQVIFVHELPTQT